MQFARAFWLVHDVFDLHCHGFATGAGPGQSIPHCQAQQGAAHRRQDGAFVGTAVQITRVDQGQAKRFADLNDVEQYLECLVESAGLCPRGNLALACRAIRPWSAMFTSGMRSSIFATAAQPHTIPRAVA